MNDPEIGTEMNNPQRYVRCAVFLHPTLIEDRETFGSSEDGHYTSLPKAASNNQRRQCCNWDSFYNITDCVLAIYGIIIIISLFVVILLVSYIIYFKYFDT